MIVPLIFTIYQKVLHDTLLRCAIIIFLCKGLKYHLWNNWLFYFCRFLRFLTEHIAMRHNSEFFDLRNERSIFRIIIFSIFVTSSYFAALFGAFISFFVYVVYEIWRISFCYFCHFPRCLWRLIFRIIIFSILFTSSEFLQSTSLFSETINFFLPNNLSDNIFCFFVTLSLFTKKHRCAAH